MLFGLFKKKAVKSSPEKTKPEGELIGEITHYFSRPKAGIVKLKKPLVIGDSIAVKGHTTDFSQKITSLEIDNKHVTDAGKNKEAGFVAKKRVRAGDKVYKI